MNMQKNKFLLINATAVTLSQGHRKVIQYISPDLFILCYEYVRFGTNGFDMRGKSLCSGGYVQWRKWTENIKSPQIGVT